MIALLVLVVMILLIGGGIWVWPLVAGLLGMSSVTDKPGALSNIAQLMTTYDIALAEVETAFHGHSAASPAPNRRSKSEVGKTLFIYLGALFIISGIGTYISMFWDNMGSAMRIFVTLGVGYILLIVLVSALQEGKYPRFILPLTLACVFMMTDGWFVFLHELFPRINDWHTTVLFVSAMMTLQVGVLFGKYRLAVMAFISLLFAYGFLYVGLNILGVSITYNTIILGASLFLVGTALEETDHPVLVETALLFGICWLNTGLFILVADFTDPNWASLIIGVSVTLTAYGLQKAARYPRLSVLCYFIGSSIAYMGLFELVQNTSVELIYIAVSASILYACVVLQSRALLMTTVIATLGFIGYYSAEHFANSLGWPVTLILLGVTFLGVGTMAMKVKQRI
jgi:hypothetical protein